MHRIPLLSDATGGLAHYPAAGDGTLAAQLN